jgi:hypothetical protein
MEANQWRGTWKGSFEGDPVEMSIGRDFVERGHWKGYEEGVCDGGPVEEGSQYATDMPRETAEEAFPVNSTESSGRRPLKVV